MHSALQMQMREIDSQGIRGQEKLGKSNMKSGKVEILPLSLANVKNNINFV